MPRKTSRIRSFLEMVGSVRLGVVLLVLVAASSVLGTVVLQSTLPGGDPVSISRHYGETVRRVLEALRLTDVFHAPWYHALMGLLALNILCATIVRFSLRPERWGFLLAHAGVLLTLVGGLVYFVRGDKGAVVVVEGETVDRYVSRRARDYRPLPFSVGLDRFEIDWYPGEMVFVGADNEAVSVHPREGAEVKLPWDDTHVTFERVIPDARRITEIVPPPSTSPDAGSRIETRYEPEEPAKSSMGTPAALLDVTAATGKRYRFWMSTDGRDRLVKLGDDLVIEYVREVKEYRSRATLGGDGPDALPFTIRVNHPAAHMGWQLFQESYFPHEGRYASQLAVSRDPGLPLAYVGLTLITVGVFYACFVKPVLRRRDETRSTKHETSTKFK